MWDLISWHYTEPLLIYNDYNTTILYTGRAHHYLFTGTRFYWKQSDWLETWKVTRTEFLQGLNENKKINKTRPAVTVGSVCKHCAWHYSSSNAFFLTGTLFLCCFILSLDVCNNLCVIIIFDLCFIIFLRSLRVFPLLINHPFHEKEFWFVAAEKSKELELRLRKKNISILLFNQFDSCNFNLFIFLHIHIVRGFHV